jgi:L-malate glycosyltransferase
MKKLLIFHHDASLYGASRSLLGLLENKAFTGDYSVLVILPYHGQMEAVLTSMEISYKVIAFPRCIASKARTLFDKANNAIRYYIEKRKSLSILYETTTEFSPDFIYTNTSAVSIGYDIAKHLNIPHVWHVREYGDLDYGFQYLPMMASVKRKIKASNTVIFASNVLRLHWVGAGYRCQRVIYNGLISDGCKKPLPKQLDTSRINFGILGAVIPGKGQDVAIEAFAFLVKRYPLAQLHVWGSFNDREYQHKLKFMINKYKLTSNVFFHPFDNDNSNIYEGLDVVLNCSLHEGFGRTVVEAMGRGIPVIANACGGPLEIVDDGINGLFYNQSASSLAKKMEALIADRNLYCTISKNAIEKAYARFSKKGYQEEILNVLFKLPNK